MSSVRIRPIDPTSNSEVELVAQWMRATLVEVEGEETGTALYSMEWLCERVRWHLCAERVAAVLLAEDASSKLIGHTIVRREGAEGCDPFGLVSTTYVQPEARRGGVADELLCAGEQWFAQQQLGSFTTWTSSTNAKLIQLYQKHGYRQAESATHETTGTTMVRLEKIVAVSREG